MLNNIGQEASKMANISQTGEVQETQQKESPQKKTEKQASKKGSLLSRLLDGDKAAKEELVQNARTFPKSPTMTQKPPKHLQRDIGKGVSEMLYGKENYDEIVTIQSQTIVQHETESDAQKTKKKEKEKEDFTFKKEDEEGKAFDQKTGLRTKPHVSARQMQKKYKKMTKQQRDQETQEFRENGKQLVKKYSEHYTKYMFSKSSEQKKKMETVRKDMRDMGFSNKKLAEMDKNVGNMVRQHVAMDIKKRLIRYYLQTTENKGKKVADQELFSFLTDMENNENLGGKDFGNYKGGLSQVVQEQMSAAKKEMVGFIFDEVEHAWIQNAIDGDPEAMAKKIMKMQKLAMKLESKDFSLQDIMKRVRQTVDDMGLFHFVPPSDGMITMAFFDEERNRKRKDEPIFYITEEDMLEDKLRSLFMLKSMNPGMKNKIELAFSIRKCKRGLIKLGVYTDKRVDELEQEGHFLAKTKLMEDLQQACREQATLVELDGPSFEVIKERKAFCIKCLRKIGEKLGKADLIKIQDQANLEIYPVLKHELYLLEVSGSLERSQAANRKASILKANMERLIEESKIDDDMTMNINGTTHIPLDRNIIEAA